MKNNSLFSYRIYTAVFVFAGLFLFFWYKPFSQTYAYADDYITIEACLRLPLNEAISSSGSVNFRPITSLLFYIIIHIFQYNMFGYYLLNILLQSCIAVILARKLGEISNNLLVGTCFSFVYLISNFGLYGIVQMEGIMELLCIMFLVLSFSSVYDMFFKEFSDSACIFSFCIYALIVYTHERFLVLVIPLILAAILNRKKMKRKWLPAVISVLGILWMLGNYLIKLYLLEMPFLRGTGGTLMEFSISNIIRHVIYHIMFMFGIHNEATYLCGIAGSAVHPVVNLVILLSVLSVFSIFILYVSMHLRFKKQSPEHLSSILFLLTCLIAIGLMIGSSSTTIRVEQRWVYAPFTVALIMLAHMFCVVKERFSHNPKEGKYAKKTVVMLLLVYFVTNITYTVYYRSHFDNIFLMQWHREAAALHESSYTLGTKTYLGTGISEFKEENLKYLLSGFSTAEDQGVWSDSSNAVFTVPLLDISQDLFFEIEVHPINDYQEIEFFVNSQLADTTVVENDGVIRLRIPKNLLISGYNSLEFRLPNAMSLYEAGLGEDRRLLSVFIRSFSLQKS